MASSEPNVAPSRPWDELIRDSRQRGTRIKRRRRAVAVAPALVLSLVVGVALVSDDGPVQRLRTDPRKIQIPTDPNPPDVDPRPDQVRPAPGQGRGVSPAGRPAAAPRVSSPKPVTPRALPTAKDIGLLPTDKVAFEIDGGDYDQVGISNGDGSGQQTLTQPVGNNRWPSWSPDGKQIAFASSRRTYTQYFDREVFELFVMNADGSNAHLVLPFAGASAGNGINRVVWSPDGKEILFTEVRPGLNSPDLAAVKPDGSGRRWITNTPNIAEIDANWSPDSRHLVYGTAGQGIWISDRDGANSRKVLTGGATPVWSPDGHWIALQDADDKGASFISLWDPDDGAKHRVVDAPSGGVVTHPQFTADSAHVVYVYDPDNIADTFILVPGQQDIATGGPQPAELRVARVDGKEERTVVEGQAGQNRLKPSVRPRGG